MDNYIIVWICILGFCILWYAIWYQRRRSVLDPTRRNKHDTAKRENAKRIQEQLNSIPNIHTKNIKTKPKKTRRNPTIVTNSSLPTFRPTINDRYSNLFRNQGGG